MRKSTTWFNRQKLNIKFTLVIGIIIFIPVTIIFSILFSNMKKNEIAKALSNTEYTMNQNYVELQKIIDLCNVTTQAFVNNKSLTDFLVRLKTGEPEIKTMEFYEFKSNDVAVLERLSSNPYLHRIRVYAKNDSFSEIIPILYHNERMMFLPWSDDFISDEWYFNYTDDILEESRLNSAKAMMALITSVADDTHGETGVLEVAVKMEEAFPAVFSDDEYQWGVFIDRNGQFHVNDERTDEHWAAFTEEIVSIVSPEEDDEAEERYIHTKVDGEDVIIGYLPVKEFSGAIVQLVSIEETLAVINEDRNLFLIVFVLSFGLLIILVNYIVKVLLRQFYDVLKGIRQVQKGDLNVVIPSHGSDEMSELGTQINKMLERINRLIEENFKRELLMKDSEIRALQNQINAHFIYNVLESIKMMAEIDEEYAISDAVTSLGKLLRYSMKWTSGNVTIRQEIDYIKNYLDLINLRFDYEIILSLNIPEMIYHQEIPKMSLQPIVENAIVHGIEELAEDATIYMKAHIEGSIFTIEVTDSGQGMTQETVSRLQSKILGELEVSSSSGNGIGLKNVQDRIRIAFGDAYGIEIISKLDCFTKVIVKLPLLHSGKFIDEREGM